MELVLVFVLGVCGGILGIKLNLPAGGLIGALLFVITYRLIFFDRVIEMPSFVVPGVQILIGIVIGLTFATGVLSQLKTMIVPAVISVLVLYLFTLGVALLLTKFAGFNPVTAVLSMAPGGIAEIMTLSLSFGGNSALILLFHMLRIIVVILSTPFIVRWIAG